ncbi:MAG: hypothetical protein ACI923_002507, partial [Flavobacteriales bacterium]
PLVSFLNGNQQKGLLRRKRLENEQKGFDYVTGTK